MIGMSQIKKRMYVGLAIGLVIGAILVGLTVWWALSTIKGYEQGTNKKYLTNYTQEVAVLNVDVVQGELITEDMLNNVRVHKSTVPSAALDKGSVVGQAAKFNISANVPITSDMISDQILSADVRQQELNTVLMPSDLNEGEYVDVRIMYPNGTDYIVLAQKQVDKISSQTMWINVTEDERLLLNGAMVDSFLRQGTKLYATKYADPQSQIKLADEESEAVKGYLNNVIKEEMATFNGGDETTIANTVFDMIIKYKNFAATVTRTSENYQPNTQVIEMMKSNKNILAQAIERLTLDARSIIDNANEQYESTNIERYSNVISGAQQAITAQQTERNNLLNGQ